MYQGHKIILTVCARGGSKGVPGKNIQPLLGKPLIGYTLEQAKKLPWVDRIAVSTDDPKIKQVAENYGIEVPFMRPKILATDSAAKVPTIIHAIQSTEKYWQEKYDIDIDLDVTCPLRTLADIENCLKLLLEPGTKVVFSVFNSPRNPYFNMVEPDRKGYLHLSKKLLKPIVRRQDAPRVYGMNSSIWAAWVKDLCLEKTYFTNQTRGYLMPDERSIDIDRPIDFDFVEFMLKKNHAEI